MKTIENVVEEIKEVIDESEAMPEPEVEEPPVSATDAAMEKSVRQLLLLEQVSDAHKETRTGWWNDLVKDVMDDSNPHVYFMNYEDKYKEISGAKRMPSTYRSAKTTIIKALEADVDLWDGENNKAFGKTAVGNKVKAKTATVAPPERPVAKIMDALATAIYHMHEVHDPEERKWITMRIADVAAETGKWT